MRQETLYRLGAGRLSGKIRAPTGFSERACCLAALGGQARRIVAPQGAFRVTAHSLTRSLAQCSGPMVSDVSDAAAAADVAPGGEQQAALPAVRDAACAAGPRPSLLVRRIFRCDTNARCARRSGGVSARASEARAAGSRAGSKTCPGRHAKPLGPKARRARRAGQPKRVKLASRVWQLREPLAGPAPLVDLSPHFLDTPRYLDTPASRVSQRVLASASASLLVSRHVVRSSVVPRPGGFWPCASAVTPFPNHIRHQLPTDHGRPARPPHRCSASPRRSE